MSLHGDCDHVVGLLFCAAIDRNKRCLDETNKVYVRCVRAQTSIMSLTSLLKVLEYQLTHILLSCNKITRTFEHRYVTKKSISAHTLGLAIGNFVMSSTNENSRIRSYGTATTTNMSILRKCTADCDNMLRWIQEYLQSKYPYSSSDEKEVVYHKQVFVHGLEIPDTESVTPPHVLPLGGMFSGMKSFCTLVLLPASLLHDPERHLDICDHTNLTQTHGLARQWFGCLVRAKSYPDSWILESLSAHIVNHYVKTMKRGKAYMSRIDTINEMIVHCTLFLVEKVARSFPIFSSSVKENGVRKETGRRSMRQQHTPLHPASIAVVVVSKSYVVLESSVGVNF